MLRDFIDFFFYNEVFQQALDYAFKLAPIFVPFGLLALFIKYWLAYKRAEWIRAQGHVLLEIRLPKEITKSPVAMEIVVNTFLQGVVGSYIDVFLKGRVRPWFSLEMVSIGGNVKFFIWTFKSFKNLIEAQIYSQYPNVEILESHDYSLDVVYDPDKLSLFGSQLKLTKPDAYPIKTYIDYGLEKNPKEEEKVDPITPVLEFLGSLRPGEQAWYQILIQQHRGEGLKDARILKKSDWRDAAKAEIKKIIEKEAFVKPSGEKPPSFQELSDEQKKTVAAIERSLSKPAFDTMIRCLYLGEKEIYNPANIGGLLGSFRQFSSNTLNGLIPNWTSGITYPWEDFRGIRKREKESSILDAYKRRSYFQDPYKHFGGKPFILTTEEVATIFHFPGQVASTPSFERISSKKSEAPTNLPI